MAGNRIRINFDSGFTLTQIVRRFSTFASIYNRFDVGEDRKLNNCQFPILMSTFIITNDCRYILGDIGRQPRVNE